MEQSYRTYAEARFAGWKPVDVMGEMSAPAKSPGNTDHRSQLVVTPEALDAASYILNMTAQLEDVAVAARLDLLAYFLGMAKSESELFVRTNVVGEAVRAEK